MEYVQKEIEFSNEVMKLSQSIQKMVERLAAFLKEREMKGVLKIFFRHGRLILELILFQCNISNIKMSYGVIKYSSHRIYSYHGWCFGFYSINDVKK